MAKIKATLIDHMGSDLSVVRSARVSFYKNSEALGWGWYEYPDGSASGDYIAALDKRDEKLIHFLAKNQHYSPFNHTNITFHVKAPVFVARQLVKHEYLPWNEVSRRYVDDNIEFYVPDKWRGRSKNKKQGSDGVVDLGDTLSRRLYFLALEQLDAYNTLISEGVAPEQARMILPQSLMTEWYWSGTLKAFHKMCKLRCAPDSQYESRIVADQISKALGELFPVSWSALMEIEDDTK